MSNSKAMLELKAQLAEANAKIKQLQDNRSVKVDEENSAVYFNDTIKVVSSVTDVTTQKGVKKQKILGTINIESMLSALEKRASYGCKEIPNQVTIEMVPYASNNKPLPHGSLAFAGEARLSLKYYDKASS